MFEGGNKVSSIRQTKLLCVAVLSVLLVFPGRPASAIEGEQQTIRSLTQKWIDASAVGDLDAYLSFLTDDFAWIGDQTNGGYQGREAVRSFVGPFFDTMTFSLEDWTSDEVIMSGSRTQAVHIWTGTAISRPKDGSDEAVQHRRYIDYWAKQPDGKWLCYRHTFVVLQDHDPIGDAKQVVRAHERFAMSNDLEGVMSNVAEDAVFLAYGVPLIEGKDAFREFDGGMMAAGTQRFGHQYTGEDVIGSDIVILRGVSQGSLTAGDSNVSEFSNNFMHILRRGRDGKFKFWRASFAPDAPAALLGN